MGLSSKSRSGHVSLPARARHPPKYCQRLPLCQLRGMAIPSPEGITIRSCTVRSANHDFCIYGRMVRERCASDIDHASASQWLNQNSDSLLTTDYIIDETLTLLRARAESTRAIRLGEQFFSGALARAAAPFYGTTRIDPN